MPSAVSSPKNSHIADHNDILSKTGRKPSLSSNRSQRASRESEWLLSSRWMRTIAESRRVEIGARRAHSTNCPRFSFQGNPFPNEMWNLYSEKAFSKSSIAVIRSGCFSDSLTWSAQQDIRSYALPNLRASFRNTSQSPATALPSGNERNPARCERGSNC